MAKIINPNELCCRKRRVLDEDGTRLAVGKLNDIVEYV